jgi:hypothetical protein
VMSTPKTELQLYCLCFKNHNYEEHIESLLPLATTSLTMTHSNSSIYFTGVKKIQVSSSHSVFDESFPLAVSSKLETRATETERRNLDILCTVCTALPPKEGSHDLPPTPTSASYLDNYCGVGGEFTCSGHIRQD